MSVDQSMLSNAAALSPMHRTVATVFLKNFNSFMSMKSTPQHIPKTVRKTNASALFVYVFKTVLPNVWPRARALSAFSGLYFLV